MQGKGAAAAIVAALDALAAHAEVDVVVLARGGGSFEDLLPFSDEVVVRAVAACRVPVVSAVGHEQDTPLCDLAADARAATPTAAGALVVPDLGELESALRGARRRLGLAVTRAARARPQQARATGRAAARRAAPPPRAAARGARPLGRAAAGAVAARDARPRLRDRARRRRRPAERGRGADRRPPRHPARRGLARAPASRRCAP